jgi:hypothetical protein
MWATIQVAKRAVSLAYDKHFKRPITFAPLKFQAARVRQLIERTDAEHLVH